jgi:putative MATE family efflux protein
LLSKQRLNRILGLSVPIIGAMVSQNVLNLVDTAMVGTLGNAALAAVGLGGFALFMFQALILGISTGVQATSSRRKGEGQHDKTAVPLNAALLIVLIAGPVLSAFWFYLTPYLYPHLNSDPDVIRQGVPYLQIRILAIMFVGMNYSFRGYWNAVDHARLYMGTLVIMHSLNILLNYILIFGHFGAPAMGTSGAGLASALAMMTGTGIYFFLGLRHAKGNGFLHGLPTRAELGSLIRLSLPNSLQQMFFAAGFTVTFWIVGQVGTPELAAANVLINVTLVAILPGIGFGLAAATLVGQALGRGDALDARQWGWDVTKVGVITLGVLGIPMWLTPDLILGIFLHDPATLTLARIPMRLVGALMAFEAISLILMHGLLGAGDSRRVMAVSISSQWLIFLPLAYLAGPVMGLGLVGIWVLQGVYRSAQALVFLGFWRGGRWADIAV